MYVTEKFVLQPSRYGSEYILAHSVCLLAFSLFRKSVLMFRTFKPQAWILFCACNWTGMNILRSDWFRSYVENQTSNLTQQLGKFAIWIIVFLTMENMLLFSVDCVDVWCYSIVDTGVRRPDLLVTSIFRSVRYVTRYGKVRFGMLNLNSLHLIAETHR